MAYGVFDPENYCPICGQKLPEKGVGVFHYRSIQDHACAGKTLSAIDSAANRDEVMLRVPHLIERLKDGFALLREDDEPEPEEPRYFH